MPLAEVIARMVDHDLQDLAAGAGRVDSSPARAPLRSELLSHEPRLPDRVHALGTEEFPESQPRRDGQSQDER